jgi:hypothetical protein
MRKLDEGETFIVTRNDDHAEPHMTDSDQVFAACRCLPRPGRSAGTRKGLVMGCRSGVGEGRDDTSAGKGKVVGAGA